VCREGPPRVLELVRLGADFTRNADGSLHLTREGGHTNRRIVHATDLTGREIERALLARARDHPNIAFFEHHLATELVVDTASGGVLHCFGADVLDQRGGGMARFLALSTMLATGGAGQVYPSTTNPHVATGDGMAMAYRAGAAISNMEFVQFHPTALYSPPAPAGSSGSKGSTRASAGATERTFLITEAVRGEGGMLFNLQGELIGPDARGGGSSWRKWERSVWLQHRPWTAADTAAPASLSSCTHSSLNRRALHAALRLAPGARPARRGGARDPRPDAVARRAPRAARHLAQAGIRGAVALSQHRGALC
jgi:succinate dehydrogenase/fumarate reductase flavoprotein subunit